MLIRRIVGLFTLTLASTSGLAIAQNNTEKSGQRQYNEYQTAFLEDVRFIEKILYRDSAYSLCELSVGDPCAPPADPPDFPLKHITDFASYSRALQVRVSAYNDPHIAVQSAGMEQWYFDRSNGLSLVFENGAWKVDYANDYLRRAGVSSGSNLISCTTSSELFLFRVLAEPLSALHSLPIEPGPVRESGDICRFLTESGIRSVPIPDSPPSREEILSALTRRASGMEAQFAIAQIEGGLLVGLPNFRDRGIWEEMQAILLSRKEVLSNARFVVIDLRGNSGGDSRIGDALVGALSRVSPGSYGLTEAHRTFLTTSERTRSWVLRNAPELLPKLEDAKRKGEAILEWRDERSSFGAASPIQSIFAKPVFVIVDSTCASSCLMLLDRLADDPAVTIVGEATSSDSRLGETLTVDLPSGQGVLFFPLKMWPDRERGPTEYYSPDLPMDDSARFSVEGLMKELACSAEIDECSGSPYVESDVVTSSPLLISTDVSSQKPGVDEKSFQAELEFRFSARMKSGSYSLVQGGSGVTPDCPVPPEMRDDGRTIVFDCRLETNRRYSVQLNSQRFKGFRTQGDENILSPVVVHFSTE